MLTVGLAMNAEAATPMHNSTNLGSSKWSVDGGWGVAGGKYGEFKCTTCHEPGASNIKRIKGTITVPDTSKGNIPGSTAVFQTVSSMGNDAGGHATSQRVCEVCHSANKYHNYNTTNNTGGLTHNNLKDCTTCHPHSKGFAAAGCDNCHGNPPTTNTLDPSAPMTGLVNTPSPTGATSPINAGGHLVHNNKGYSCNACHNGHTMPTVSNTIQMGFNFFAASRGGTFTGYTSLSNGYTFVSSNAGTTVLRRNNYNNTCANLYCHGGGDSVNGKAVLTGGSNKIPSWVGGISQASCGTCHATTGATYNVTGSHNTHANTLAISCSKCHGVITNNAHVDGSVFWKLSTSWNRVGASATYSGSASNSTGAVAPSASFGNCASLYCHSDGNGGPPLTSPVTWGGSIAGNCQGCHGGSVTPASLNTLSHQAHMNNAAYLGTNFKCGECHAKTVGIASDTVVTNSANHINAFKDYSGAKAYRTGYSGGNCTTYCHSGGKAGAPAATAVNWTTGPVISDCKACHGVTGSFAGEPTYANGAAPLVNNHNKHVASAGDCVKCHFRTTANGTAIVAGSTMHIDKVMNVNFSRPNTLTNYSGVYNNGTRTCSTTYCHGGSAPVWGGSALACNACHESSNLLPQGHTIHWASTANASKFSNMSGNVSTAGAYRFTCSSCHGTNGTLHAGGPIAAQSAADIFFGFSSAGRGAAANTAYNSTRPGTGVLDSKNFYYTTGGAGSCNSTYCHSNGKGGNGINAFYNWTSNIGSLGCGGCHGLATTTGGNALSGRHEKHVNNATYLGTNFKCAECHDKTLDAASDTTVTDKAKHVNKFIDYSGASAYKAGFNTGTKVCSTSWCHSNGKLGTSAAYTASVTWTTAAVPRFRCNQCHGNVSSTYGEPGYANGGVGTTANNHTIHVVTKQITCDKCHRNTVKLNSYTTLLATNTAHLNKNIQDVAFNSYSVNGRGYTMGTKTCTNIYCHSNGKGGYVNPIWGQTTLNCGGCHAINSLSAGHRFHIYTSAVPTLFNYTANKSTSLRYNYGCAICHPVVSTGHNNGSVELNFMPGETNTGWLKTKNSASVTASGVVGTANSGTYGTSGSNVKCFNVYCHSNGYTTTFKFYTSPEWYTSAGAPTDKCAMCHGNSPNTNRAGDNKLMVGSPSHYNANWLGTGQAGGHAMGIHAMKISKGTNFVSLMTPGTTDPSSHGATATVTATTINCDTCHNSVVTSSANDKNVFCTTCHTGTPKGNAAIADKSKHSNGTVAVAFKTTTVYSKAQLRDASFSLNSSSTLWHRNNSYKANNSYDSSKQNLNVSTYTAGSCTTICHFNKPVNWSVTPGSVSCQSCHTSM